MADVKTLDDLLCREGPACPYTHREGAGGRRYHSHTTHLIIERHKREKRPAGT